MWTTLIHLLEGVNLSIGALNLSHSVSMGLFVFFRETPTLTLFVSGCRQTSRRDVSLFSFCSWFFYIVRACFVVDAFCFISESSFLFSFTLVPRLLHISMRFIHSSGLFLSRVPCFLLFDFP